MTFRKKAQIYSKGHLRLLSKIHLFFLLYIELGEIFPNLSVYFDVLIKNLKAYLTSNPNIVSLIHYISYQLYSLSSISTFSFTHDIHTHTNETIDFKYLINSLPHIHFIYKFSFTFHSCVNSF